MQLSVFGLGHAGAVVAGCLVARGHEVVAFDPDPDRVATIQRGAAPVNEPGLAALIKQGVESGRLTATISVADAVANSVLSSVCPRGSPADPGGLADLAHTCRQIGVALGAKAKFHAVAVRATLPPGATRSQVIPALERASGKRAGIDFGVAVYPTLLRRGSAIQDCVNPPAILFGATDDETLARLREMEIALQAPEMVVDLAEAETLSQPVAGLAQAPGPAGQRSALVPGLAPAASNPIGY